MFTVFSQGDVYLMTVVAGGVAQYEITITVPAEDVESFRRDENKAIALAKDVATRTSAYEDRMIRPAVDPS
jgi:hypothetical protein